MRLLTFIVLLLILAEFRAEVHGKPTIIGCYIRGFDRLSDSRCN